MTIKLSGRGFCVGTALIGLQSVSSSAFARSEDGIVKLGLIAPMSGPNARYGAFSLRGAQMAAKEINGAGGVGGGKINITPGDSLLASSCSESIVERVRALSLLHRPFQRSAGLMSISSGDGTTAFSKVL